MPFAGYLNFADCVSQNQDKDDPEAYCGTIKQATEQEAPKDSMGCIIGEEVWSEAENKCVALTDDEKTKLAPLLTIMKKQYERRHVDFQRIYDEFINYYKQREIGESEYHAWLKSLRLDETCEYGNAHESFRWAKDMLSFLKEDADNKYYKILVGFPLKSMNGTVYKERDLIAAAMSMKGKHPSLNHKDEFWFSPENPENKWGNLTVQGGKYEDGAVEAILQVPKDAVCPICNGALMTELIDNQRIVNVSLEGVCAGEVCYDGSCEGFTFTDPPFTLLTTDVLPGIPLARIKPLEAYLPFSRSSINRGKRKKEMKKKTKIKLKIREERDPAKMGQKKPPTTGRDAAPADSNVYKLAPQGTSGGPSGKTFRGNLQGVSQQTDVAVGTDPAHAKPEGVWQTDITEPAGVYPAEATVGSPMHVKPSDQPELASPADPMPEVDSHVGPDKAKEPPTHLDMPEGDTTMHPTAPGEMEPKPAHDCPEDHHWSAEAGKCEPDASAIVPADAGVKVPLEQEAPSPPCPDGWHEVDGKCVKNTVEQETPTPPCPEGWHEIDGKCIKNATEQDETPSPPCPEGWHQVDDHCVKDAPVESLPSLEERRARIYAELRASSSEEQAIGWEKKHSEAYRKYATLTTRYKELNRLYESVNARAKRERETANQKIENLIVRMERVRGDYDKVCGDKTKLEQNLSDLNINYKDVHRKYNEALSTNLSLSKKLTRANEDYLEIAKAKELIAGKFTRARSNAKKTLKLKL